MMTFENKQWISDNFWTTLIHRGALKLHHQSLDALIVWGLDLRWPGRYILKKSCISEKKFVFFIFPILPPPVLVHQIHPNQFQKF